MLSERFSFVGDNIRPELWKSAKRVKRNVGRNFFSSFDEPAGWGLREGTRGGSRSWADLLDDDQDRSGGDLRGARGKGGSPTGRGSGGRSGWNAGCARPCEGGEGGTRRACRPSGERRAGRARTPGSRGSWAPSSRASNHRGQISRREGLFHVVHFKFSIGRCCFLQLGLVAVAAESFVVAPRRQLLELLEHQEEEQAWPPKPAPQHDFPPFAPRTA